MEHDKVEVEMGEMKKQVKNQADVIKGMSEMMSKFVSSVITGQPKKEQEIRTDTRADCSIRTPNAVATARNTVWDYKARSELLQLL